MKTNFDKVVLIKDDAGKWNICMIAEGQLRSCLIAAEDAKEYFATDEQHQTNIAMCYWWAIERGFIEQTDLFLGHINDEQKKKIERVNIFTNKEGKKMILVTIKDLGKQPPREISDIMWQRMWIYPDMAEFKIRLACEYYKDSLLTPPSSLLTQYNELKRKHPDALLLFRTNDFYETYKEDAEKAAKALGITLTRSSQTKDEDGKPLAMAGFPYHALDTYLPKLIRAGHRVAICDRIEQPKR